MSGEARSAHGNPATLSELEALKPEIEALDALDLDLLRRRWRNLLGRPAPARLSRPLMLRILAYRHQVERVGDLDRATRLALGEAVGDPKGAEGGGAGKACRAGASAALKPGTVLEREYGGVLHRVRVTDAGCSWNGREFRSLSEAARAITGTKWNGPRFFGATPRKKPEKRDKGKTLATVAAEVGP